MIPNLTSINAIKCCKTELAQICSKAKMISKLR